jgi:hypothetical protein
MNKPAFNNLLRVDALHEIPCTERGDFLGFRRVIDFEARNHIQISVSVCFLNCIDPLRNENERIYLIDYSPFGFWQLAKLPINKFDWAPCRGRPTAGEKP